MTKRPKLNKDSQELPPREFEDVHSDVVSGKTTIVLTPNGFKLALYPSKDTVHTLDRHKLTWDFLANMMSAASAHTDSAVTLKDRFLALSPDSINYISFATKYGWGLLHEPITGQHEPLIDRDALCF